MSYFYIDKALVVHASSRDYRQSGNHRINPAILTVICSLGNLTACHARIITAIGLWIDQMVSNRVIATVAYPRAQQFSLADWSMKEMLRVFDHHRIPLLLPFDQTDWSEVHRICTVYRNLLLIVTKVDYRQLRYLLPLWAECENLYLDISWLSIADGLAYLVANGRCDNLFFGSNYPGYTLAGAVALVTWPDISETDKRKIAREN